MALVVYDRVQEVTATTGTGTLTLGGPVTGFQSFAVVGNGNTTYYTIVNGSAWEVGIGTYSSTGPTLARTTVLSNSNGTTSPITLVGASNVFVTYPAEKSINYDANNVAAIGSTLGYSDTGIIGSFASTVAGYNQVIIQNKSTSSSASSNFNVSNDAATATTGYAELGINSSTYTGTGAFNIAGASYLASASTDLAIGTYGAYNVHFVTNNSNTDAMTIFNSGGVSLGGQPDPGLGTLYANNVYLGFTTITAAAGTTVLTNSSSGWQQVVGTTTQTIQLPDATTLYKGLAYTIANNSTGAVTIKDNASTTLDTTVTGGSSILVLTNNSTSAGTWVAYSYIPSSYDFSTSTANFGGATITNATWNGSTIGTGYGGTGLTTFGAANYALYSTSSSALAAGTLPTAAGGTGATTLTGYVYGNGTGAFTASTTIPFSSITGTVPISQGGTGQTTANTAFNALSPLTTAGDILYGATSGAGTRLGIGTAGQVLTVNSGATAPQWSTPTTGTVTSVSVVSANGFAGTVATATTTPAITLTTSITGVLKGNGTAISAATSGTDYAPATSGSSILYGNGSGGFSNVTVGTGLSFSTGTLSATPANPSVTTKTTTYSIATTDGSIFCNATSAGFTVTLPTAVGVGGKIYIIKKIDSSTNVITIATTSSQTIDSLTTQTLSLYNAWLQVQSDGSNWQIIG